MFFTYLLTSFTFVEYSINLIHFLLFLNSTLGLPGTVLVDDTGLFLGTLFKHTCVILEITLFVMSSTDHIKMKSQLVLEIPFSCYPIVLCQN